MNNIQIKSEKFKLSRLIDEEEMKKANLLLQIGQLAYQKIREKAIVDSSFEELCNSIMESDIKIYEHCKKIEELDKANSNEVCICGEVCKYGSKFCPSCGNELNIEKYDYIECSLCHKEIESDSRFCACCGQKIVEHHNDYSIKEYITKADDYEDDDEPCID